MARFRRRVVLAKIETVYGTDPVPTGAANALLMRNVDITPFASDLVERTTVRSWRGIEQSLHANTHVVIEGELEFTPSGTKDVPPKYSPMVRACAFAEAITATVKVAYTLISASDESTTVHFFIDDSRHIATGVRGTLSGIRLASGEIAALRGRWLGLYNAPTATANAVPDFSAYVKPKIVNKANTPTFTLHGFAGVLAELTIDLGNEVAAIDRVGSTGKHVDIADRSPSGTIVIEAPALGTKDFFAIAVAETTGALQVVHGSGDGGIVQVDAPNVQLINPRYTALPGGTAGLAMDLRLVPGAAGDDELVITTK